MDVVSEEGVAWLPESTLLVQPLLSWFAFYIAAKLAARLYFTEKGQSVQEVSSSFEQYYYTLIQVQHPSHNTISSHTPSPITFTRSVK